MSDPLDKKTHFNAKKLDSEEEEISAKTIKFPSPISDENVTVKDGRSDKVGIDSYNQSRREKLRYIEKHYKDVWKIIKNQPLEFFEGIPISFKGDGAVFLHFKEGSKIEFYVSDLRNSRIGFGFWLETETYSVAPDLYEVDITYLSYVSDTQIDQIYEVFNLILERERSNQDNTEFEELLRKYLDLSKVISMGFDNPERKRKLDDLFFKIQNWVA